MDKQNKYIRPENDTKDQDIQREFPGKEIINADGTTQFPSEHDTSIEPVNSENQTELENDACLEEYIENDQNRQGGAIAVKASGEPLGRPQKDGEASGNV